jgi:hypothetical protein
VIVRCVSNRAATLPAEYQDARHGYGPGDILPLKIGKTYLAFALTHFRGGFWVYVDDEDLHPYPLWYPSPLFEIASSKLSSTWRVGVQGAEPNEWILAFEEWVSDALYYERLLNGDRDAQIAYERTKQIMAAEFGISVDDPAE